MVCVLAFVVLYFVAMEIGPDQIDDQISGYFVANNGDDLNNGSSPENPWRTIGKVNLEFDGGKIVKGDDIYFRRGDTFTDAELKIRSGGSSSDWMVIGAYGSGLKPVFSGSLERDGVDFFEGSIGFVKIQDLEIRDQKNGIRVRQPNTNDVWIYNVDLFDNGNCGIILDQIDSYKIENCNANRSGNGGIVVHGSPLYKTCDGQILNCTSSYVFGGDGFQIHNDPNGNEVGFNHLIINCSGGFNQEETFDITSGENIYLKDCESFGNKNVGFVLGHDVDNVTVDNFFCHDEGRIGLAITNAQNVIVRNSVFYNTGYKMASIYGNSISDFSENLVFYNNDFIWTNNSAEFNPQNYIMNLTFKNNIFASVGYSYPNRFLRITKGGNTSNSNMSWVSNIWWRGDGGEGDDTWWYVDTKGEEISFVDWSLLFGVYNDLRVDPLLVDPVNGSFGLYSGSPAIDSGDFLTTTFGSGSGTKVFVREAGYFCDGFGLIEGDVIMVGSNSLVRVTDVDYNNNVIIINRSIIWGEDDPVSLQYLGSAPDIGAYEFTLNAKKLQGNDENNYFGMVFLTLVFFGIITAKIYIKQKVKIVMSG